MPAMDLQITYTAQYGLEWRVVLSEQPKPRRAVSGPDFRLPDDLAADDFPTQEATVHPELRPRTHVELR
jgi:hypothetical protein